MQCRVESTCEPADSPTRRDAWLAPVELHERAADLGLSGLGSRSGKRASDLGFLPMTFDDYLRLLDWTRRPIKQGSSIATREQPLAVAIVKRNV